MFWGIGGVEAVDYVMSVRGDSDALLDNLEGGKWTVNVSFIIICEAVYKIKTGPKPCVLTSKVVARICQKNDNRRWRRITNVPSLFQREADDE